MKLTEFMKGCLNTFLEEAYDEITRTKSSKKKPPINEALEKIIEAHVREELAKKTSTEITAEILLAKTGVPRDATTGYFYSILKMWQVANRRDYVWNLGVLTPKSDSADIGFSAWEDTPLGIVNYLSTIGNVQAAQPVKPKRKP